MLEEISYHLSSFRFRLRFKTPSCYPPVLVNGTPKTGTTWMVKMLVSLPAYGNAGNFQGQIERYRTAAPGQVVHGHDRYTADLAAILAQQGIGVIIMLRDPRDQVVSHMYHIRRDVNNPWHDRLTSMDPDQALMTVIEGGPGLDGVRQQYTISLSWLDAGATVCCVRYEDVISDPVVEFSRVLRYLNIAASPGLVSRVVERNRFERMTSGRRFWKRGRQPGEENVTSHFRKGMVGDWRNHFGPAHVQRFKDVTNDLLVRLGYEQEGQPWG